jgi:hypothetical protein
MRDLGQLGEVLTTNISQLPGARLFIFIGLAFMFAPEAWLHAWDQLRVAVAGKGDLLADYRVIESARDYDVCRSSECTYAATVAGSSMTVELDARLLLPPVQSFVAPEEKTFIGLPIEHGVPFISMMANTRNTPLARIVSITEAQTSDDAPPVEEIHVNSPGLVTTLQPEEPGEAPVAVWRRPDSWAAYVKQHGDAQSWRFSRIEYQPVPVEWRFPVPELSARALHAGDPMTIEFKTGKVNAQSATPRFDGKIGAVVQEGNAWIVTVLPVGATALNWLAERVSAEIKDAGSDTLAHVIPEHIHVLITPSSFATTDKSHTRYVLPRTAVLPDPSGSKDRGVIWMIAEDFLLPLPVKIDEAIDQSLVIEEMPLQEKVRRQLTPFQRSRIYALTSAGRKSMLNDKKSRVLSNPTGDLKPGKPARAAPEKAS